MGLESRCSSILLICFYCLNYLKHPFIISQVCRSEVLHGVAGFSAQYHKAEIKVSNGCSSHLEALGKSVSKAIPPVAEFSFL